MHVKKRLPSDILVAGTSYSMIMKVLTYTLTNVMYGTESAQPWSEWHNPVDTISRFLCRGAQTCQGPVPTDFLVVRILK